MQSQNRLLCAVTAIGLLVGLPASVAAEVQFRSPPAAGATTQPGGTASSAPAASPTQVPADLAPVQPPAGATLQPPSFDPFSTQPGAAPSAPPLTTPPVPSPAPTQPTPGVVSPAPAQPSSAAPYPGYPAQPPVQFPGGISGQIGALGLPVPGRYLQAIEYPRFRYTWLAGDAGPGEPGRDELDINDAEVALTFNWPNFLYSGQPLQISPGFVFHFWQGPAHGTPPAWPPNLPEQAYSAYLGFDWSTNRQIRYGGEANLVIGYYSDFRSLHQSGTSIRVQGTGLGWFRLTEYSTIKAGLAYLDRLDVKILPAFGLFWYPNEDVRFEIYFPRPKLAQRLTTLGNTDIWWYVGGEYGGGSWTVKVVRNFSLKIGDPARSTIVQVDINDIRLFGGLEWLSGYLGATGFVEVGYVFDREIIYFRRDGTVPPNLPLKDTIMLRAGLSF